MSLSKLPLLFMSSMSYHLALSRPTSPDSGDKIMTVSFRERIWKHANQPTTIFLRGTMWLATVAESIVIIGSLQDTPRPSTNALPAVLNALGPPTASKLTAPFVLGACLITAGGIFRVQCYRALGEHFTFVQCIRKDHKLITTGPYAVVRHPGYASLFMCFVGSWIVFGEPGSWLRASGVLGVRWVKVMAVGWCLLKVAGSITFFRRSTDEDQFLSERFGKEWENWARRVKYKLVPFIY